ncbi:MAG: class I SAM-dependent methyltransferase [Oscillospiraceae bacterium]|nr:class I SAM-dependent methyltransferase [Oscillospiraceae bacterium]
MNEFTGKATVYDKARPGYAPAALDYIAGLVKAPFACEGGTGGAVADIGAGTGKLSAMLCARGYSVIAVEPDADMRSKLPILPNLRVIEGIAEATGLPGQSVDAVTCAQAFHWFDGERFKQECVRILKPGGRIFVIYNIPPAGHTEANAELEWQPHKYDPERWKRNDEAMLAFFGGAMRREAFDNPVYYDREHHEAYMLSHSTSPRPGDGECERFIASIAEIFERCNLNGKMLLPMETVVYTNA